MTHQNANSGDGSPLPSTSGSRLDALRHEDLSYFEELPVRYQYYPTGKIMRGHVTGVQFHNGEIEFLIRNEDGWMKHKAWARHSEIIGRDGGSEEDFIDEVVAAEYAEDYSSNVKEQTGEALSVSPCSHSDYFPVSGSDLSSSGVAKC